MVNKHEVRPSYSRSTVDQRAMRRIIVLILAMVCAAGGIIVSLTNGAVSMSASDVWTAIASQSNDAGSQVIRNIRLPRTLVGTLVGINLAAAGVILQAVMRNPLADPHIIGVSSGAGLAGVAILVLFPHKEYLLVPAAFTGAISAALIVYALAWRKGIQPIRIILAGVAVSAFLGAGISGLLLFYGDKVHGALMWMAGGLSARSWPHVWTILPYTVVGVLAALAGAQRLNILTLGDDAAQGLGLRVDRTRLVMTAAAALLAASAVSVAGLLGFVGLIVPHATRLLIGGDHRYLLPAAMLLGAGVVTGCDTAARVILAPVELPVGIIMAFIGAPFFLYLLRKN